ncbi:YheC/YheD family protein [Paenibacillus sp. YPG26]|uniref:YheC/YheD family protein n=1 Tax=Paenibacillus sp. YPG26 TaxID=2878915 RepID=UPI00204188AF|nr:YheC/YheD family protein [Paenibacillus sp. YPG26]USB33277.1 YheC/YheD family protein [Paenibacillus sp. YPG26]
MKGRKLTLSIQRIASKWRKTQILLQQSNLQPYIPETRKFSFEDLRAMIHQYGLVYIKPDRGTYGIGVMSAELDQEALDASGEIPPEGNPVMESPAPTYKLRFGIQGQTYMTFEELYSALMDKIKRRNYLIQQGIHLLTYHRRKFDIRVLVQKNLRREWETTGFIARLGALQKIITNHHGGGTSYPVERLLSHHMDEKQLELLLSELRLIGTQVGYQLQNSYPKLKELGLDIAVDSGFKAWILEVNTMPALFPFKDLKDKKIYKRIRRYAVHYGRLRKSKATS